MEKTIVSEGTLNCSGKNFEKKDKNPPLDVPVKVLIRIYNDKTQKICCPHLDDIECHAGEGKAVVKRGGRFSQIVYPDIVYPTCLHSKEEEDDDYDY